MSTSVGPELTFDDQRLAVVLLAEGDHRLRMVSGSRDHI